MSRGVCEQGFILFVRPEHFHFVQTYVCHLEVNSNCLGLDWFEMQFAERAPVFFPSADFTKDASLFGNALPEFPASLTAGVIC